MVITASDFAKAPNRDAHKTPAVLNRSFRILLPVAPLLRGYAAAASFLKCHSSSQLSKNAPPLLGGFARTLTHNLCCLPVRNNY